VSDNRISTTDTPDARKASLADKVAEASAKFTKAFNAYQCTHEDDPDDYAAIVDGRGSAFQLAGLIERNLSAILSALRSGEDQFARGRQAGRYRHVKRGSTYTKIGVAELQNSTGIECLEGAQLVIYRADNDGQLWARPEREFDDGRFEAIPAPAQVDALGRNRRRRRRGERRCPIGLDDTPSICSAGTCDQCIANVREECGRLAARLAEAEKALEPFAVVGMSDGQDIRDSLMRHLIRHWFGPSDFDATRAYFASAQKDKGNAPESLK
jgi:hypothetical protein